MDDWRKPLWDYDVSREDYRKLMAEFDELAKAANPPQRGLLDYVTDPAISLLKGLFMRGMLLLICLILLTKVGLGRRWDI